MIPEAPLLRFLVSLTRCCALPVALAFTLFISAALSAQNMPRRVALPTVASDAIPTGNEWIALPTIRAADGALVNFNALSMRDRGLLQVSGDRGAPALLPFFEVNGKPVTFGKFDWDLIEYWIPAGHAQANGVEATITYCAPPGARAAFLRLTLTNRGAAPAKAALGVQASWGALERVTYLPVVLRGERTVTAAPWVNDAEVFSYIVEDTKFAWSLIHPGSTAHVDVPPQTTSPLLTTRREAELAPGASVEALFVLGVGLEEFSGPHNAKALREELDRLGADALIARTAQWCHQRTRTTGRADLDLLMNRNFLFTANYAWGRTIDTEQFVGVTSRSPRYYVSAAYWDRDAMLWSFPGLLDSDPALAKEALGYALGIQLRNTGTHSRFIDGVVLEDGFQLDEAVAPLIAAGNYLRRTGDVDFLRAHRAALLEVRDRVLGRFDPATGLYSSLQDAQDEFQKLPFITLDNVLVWRAFQDMAEVFDRLQEPKEAAALRQRATELRKAILTHCVVDSIPGAGGTVFASATDGKVAILTEIPPGSLMRLPQLGFVTEDDPVFARTYDWLHSQNHKWAFSEHAYGLPGSYRLPITACWSVADHLQLKRGRERALKILLDASWDDGIISEGLDPDTAKMDRPGGAFATAAGYVADAICQAYCTEKRP